MGMRCHKFCFEELSIISDCVAIDHLPCGLVNALRPTQFVIIHARYRTVFKYRRYLSIVGTVTYGW